MRKIIKCKLMAALRMNVNSLTPIISTSPPRSFFVSLATSSINSTSSFRTSSAATDMATTTTKIIDSHLHVWASPEEAKDKYPYVPGQEPSLRGNFDFLLDCMGEAAVDGALIVQPINHKFDHSYLTREECLKHDYAKVAPYPNLLVNSVLKKHPSKFVGCCLANPAEDGIGVQQLEHLILEDGYRAVRFNPYLWPSGQQMTNEIGKAMFAKAGELGVPVGFMCMKGLNLHISEIEKLCSEFPKTVVLLDHLAFCKPPVNEEEAKGLSELLGLSRFPQIYVKFSALFRVSRKAFPYEDLSPLLSQIVSSYGTNRVMWGSDFPFVVEECGYKEAKEAVSLIANQVRLPSSDLEWIMGRTALQLFQGQWTAA